MVGARAETTGDSDRLLHGQAGNIGVLARVTVFEQEGLTNVYSVDQSGYLSIPLVGAVPARGDTAQQLE
ncbi:MAG: hypothetical protein E5W78_24575, partial [Mesorhizobium sp.]